MIRSTFSGFTTAQLAMSASQFALDVTGQNIANINTPGYTKQRLDIASLNNQGANFYNSNNSIKVGYGVEMTGVSQLRDPFLDSQYRSQISKLGTTDAQVAGYEQLAPIFDETTNDGILAALNNLTSSLDKLSSQAGNQEFDTMVRSNMQILLNLFHDNASRLSDTRTDISNGFKTADIADVNGILENIANLNTSIKNSQILGNPALELQDQRNDLLDQLASYLPITVKYTDQEIGANEFVQVLDVTFTSTDGVKYSLISDGNYGSLETDISGQPVTLLLNDSKGNAGSDITDSLGSGTLKGTLDFLNKSGSFDKPNSDFRGLGYYEKALDLMVNKFATTFNELNQPKIKDPNGNIIDDPNNKNPLFETTDGSATFTASNIKIAEGWVNGTYGITASKDFTSDELGSTAHDNIDKMIKALDSEITFSDNNNVFFKGSFYECFNNISSTLAVDTKSGNTILKNQISVLNQTANSKDSISGVQLDEEGMNLMHFNQSYTAAARLMTTLDEALDVLINRTGIVGR